MRGSFGSYALLGLRKVRGFCATRGNYQPSVADPRKATPHPTTTLLAGIPQFLFQILIFRQVASLPPSKLAQYFPRPIARSLSPITCLLSWHNCGESHQSLGLPQFPRIAFVLIPSCQICWQSKPVSRHFPMPATLYLITYLTQEKAARGIQDSGSS
jgi:hypothetical protein